MMLIKTKYLSKLLNLVKIDFEEIILKIDKQTLILDALTDAHTTGFYITIPIIIQKEDEENTELPLTNLETISKAINLFWKGKGDEQYITIHTGKEEVVFETKNASFNIETEDILAPQSGTNLKEKEKEFKWYHFSVHKKELQQIIKMLSPFGDSVTITLHPNKVIFQNGYIDTISEDILMEGNGVMQLTVDTLATTTINPIRTSMAISNIEPYIQFLSDHIELSIMEKGLLKLESVFDEMKIFYAVAPVLRE